MVKDEEESILKTLSSCLNVIDRLFLHDTGSTDNTIAIAKQFCDKQNITFKLVESKFVNFSESRNLLLDYAEQYIEKDEFYMVLDANDELQATWNFVSALKNIPKGINTVMVNSVWVNNGDAGDVNSHLKILLLRSGNKVRYERYVHEFTTINGHPLTDYFSLQDVSLYQDRKKENAKTGKRYSQDIILLQKELEDFGHDRYRSRTLFYLGRTFLRMKEYVSSKRYFQELFDHDGYIDPEDAYMGRMYYASILDHLDVSWGEQLKYLLEAYNLIPNKIEALITITLKYCITEEWHIAYIFAKYMCELNLKGKPHHGMNLLDYNIKRWYLLALVSYYTKHFDIGRTALSHIGDETLFKNKCPKELYTKIATLRGFYFPFYNEIQGKPIILVFGGYGYSKWDGGLINSKTGLGGSETVITYVSTLLNKHQDLPVYVCCDTKDVNIIEGVTFFPIEHYEMFASVHNIDTLFVFRYTQYVRYNPNIKRVIVVLEDTLPITDKYEKIALEYNDKLKHIVCKTNWHKKYLLDKIKEKEPDLYTNIQNKVKVIGNAIIPDRFLNQNIDKQPWRFIYSSCPTRGAWNLARLIPKIREIIPVAEFHFFVTFTCPYYKNIHRVPELKIALENTPGVIIHPRVSQQELAKEMLKSDIWLYPTEFKETYCITALEMQMARVFCIYSNNSCLDETISDRGILVDAEPNEEENDSKFLQVIRDLVDKKIDKETYLEKGYNWAIEQSWNNIIKEFLLLIK